MSRKRAVIISLLLIFSIMALVVAIYPRVSVNFTKLFPASKAIPVGFYEVVKFTDGDTFDVNMNGTTETIRLIGVDTPETHKPDTPVQCYGPEASTFTERTLKAANNSVRLEADPLDDNRDRYGRLLRYAYLPDGKLLEQLIIQQGYGFAYLSFPFQKKVEFAGYQDDAQTNKLGLWSACKLKLVSGRWQSNEAGED
jgi:micrococcal nuclease